MDNEIGEQQPVREEAKNPSYHVELNKNFFIEVGNSLTPVYKEELAKVREEGTMQENKDFHHSDRAMLMTQILDILSQDRENLPDKIGLNLSDEAYKYIKDNISASGGFGDFQITTENLRKLNEDFTAAKIEAKVKKG